MTADGAGGKNRLATIGSYDWPRYYEAAILETDRSRLPQLIAQAQEMIRERLEELRSVRDGPCDWAADEQQAIDDALAGLRILKKEIGELKPGLSP